MNLEGRDEMEFQNGQPVIWKDRPSLGVGVILEVRPATGWRSGYAVVQFTSPDHQNPFRLNFEEICVAPTHQRPDAPNVARMDPITVTITEVRPALKGEKYLAVNVGAGVASVSTWMADYSTPGPVLIVEDLSRKPWRNDITMLYELRFMASYNGIRRDWKTAGVEILRRAQKYLERGTLLSPGLSTQDYDPERRF